MENWSLTDRLTLDSRDYLLKTIDDIKAGRVVLQLFREGKISYTSEVSYGDTLPESARQQLAVELHQSHKEDLSRLFQLHLGHGIQHVEAQARYLLASAFVKYGMFQEASTNLQILLKSGSENTQARIALGKVYLRVKKYRPALDQFQQALAVHQQYADLHFYCGFCLYYLGDCVEAVKIFSRTIRLNPHYGEAHFYAALALLLNVKLAQEYRLTIRLSERVLQLLANSSELLPSLRTKALEQGVQLVTAEKFEEAFEVLAPVAHTLEDGKPSFFNHKFYLDVLLEMDQIKSEQVEQEIARLEELVQRYPQHADLYYELGFAYAVLSVGITSRSIACLNRALVINPAYPDAQRAGQLLENGANSLRTLVQTMLPFRS